MTDLTFTSSDVEAASRVLIAAATRLTERGHALWPLERLTPEVLSGQYPAGSWQVAWRQEQPVGTYVLLDRDELFWPDDPPGEARYLHKLGVHPDAQGQRLSRVLLEKAARQTHEEGASFLRLDALADRPRLLALYGAAGFRSVDQVEVQGLRVVRYELPV